VKLEQGLQMLTIFKSHEAETTIVEDFDFYEHREKALQENRRQQHAASTDTQKLVDIKVDIKAQDVVADISDAFAKAVQLKNTENSGQPQKLRVLQLKRDPLPQPRLKEVLDPRAGER
jgi:YTH domain-containing family protein